MTIITEGLSLILNGGNNFPDTLFRLGAWLGSDLATEIDQELNRMEACRYRKELEQRLQTHISALHEFDKLLEAASDTLRKVISNMDRRTLAIALRGASGKTYQTIMQGIPTNKHEALTEKINQLTSIRLYDVTEAQQEILNVLEKEMFSASELK